MARDSTQSAVARKFLLRVAVVTVATLMPLAAIEIGLRAYGYEAFRWSDRVNPQLLTATGNDALPYVLTPNAAGRGWDTDVVVNSHGFRDREFTESNENHALRVVALGDSITFGSRIADPDVLYPKRLEHLLRRHRISRNAQVLNFGVTGYDVLNDVELLRVRALRFHPDIVVIGLCVNDIGYSSTAMTYVTAQRYVGHPIFRLRVAQFVLGSVLRILTSSQSREDETVQSFARINRSHIAPVEHDGELLDAMDRLTKERPARHEQDVVRWWTELPRIGYLEYAFGKLRDFGRESGFAVVVAPVPLLDDTRVDEWRIVNEIIRHESLKFGFHVIDLSGPFEAAGLRRLRNHQTDFIHPGPRGHAIIAQALDDYMYSAGLLVH